ncbi:CaiF/GrlA family transcriptional regulator [Salmonella enterica subsp. enterica]|nr:CaiF/GrlA family transcriptional regulator [Salmonella enterica subsp. enterica serovar Sandiego]
MPERRNTFVKINIQKDTPEGGMDTENSICKKIERKGGQSNYDAFIIPPSMAEWMNEPLYLIIARWCLQQKRWVSRNDIETVFHLPVRRASFQFSYISRKKSRVVCQVRYCKRDGGGRQRVELLVEKILPEQQSPTGKKSPGSLQRKLRGGKAASARLGNGMTGSGCLWEKLLNRSRKGSSDE